MRAREGMLVLLLAACNGTDPDWEPPDVVINELVASNASGLQDASGAFPDWFELHNLGADDVDLSSWTVTDDPALPQKWSFPAGSVIEAGEYLVIFADGDPSTTDEIHTSFRLSAGGETLTLIGPAEQDLPSIDAVAFSVQTTDVAFARMPDGVGAFTEDDTPTPGAMNE